MVNARRAICSVLMIGVTTSALAAKTPAHHPSAYAPFESNRQQVIACGILAKFSESRQYDFSFDTEAARAARKQLKTEMIDTDYNLNESHVIEIMKAWNTDAPFQTLGRKCQQTFPKP